MSPLTPAQRDRLAAYVAERSNGRMRGIDPERIHDMHEGTERWVSLRLSDLAALLAATEPPWQDIATAPKDGTYVLLHAPSQQDLRPTVGRWDAQEHHTKPRPYWQTERGNLFGIAHDRGHQPTHWSPLPAPPEKGK